MSGMRQTAKVGPALIAEIEVPPFSRVVREPHGFHGMVKDAPRGTDLGIRTVLFEKPCGRFGNGSVELGAEIQRLAGLYGEQYYVHRPARPVRRRCVGRSVREGDEVSDTRLQFKIGKVRPSASQSLPFAVPEPFLHRHRPPSIVHAQPQRFRQ